MQGMLDHFAQFLIGQDPRRIEHIWQTCYRGAYFEGGKILAATLSAIDIALWDILGQSLGCPIYQLLGGACRQRGAALRDGPGLADRTGVRRAAPRSWWPRAGAQSASGPAWRARTGRATDGSIYEPVESVDLAVHWMKEVRKAVGPDIELSIDFHHRLIVVEAAYFCQRIADVNLFFLEEPIRCENRRPTSNSGRMTPIPFAIGEEFSSKLAFAPYVEAGILNFARIDVANVGGFRRRGRSRRGARPTTSTSCRTTRSARSRPPPRSTWPPRPPISPSWNISTDRGRLPRRSLPGHAGTGRHPVSRSRPPRASASPSMRMPSRTTPLSNGRRRTGSGGTGVLRTGSPEAGKRIGRRRRYWPLLVATLPTPSSS